MSPRTAPFDEALLRALAREHGTPLYVQGLDEIPARVASLEGFDVVRYAMKANPSDAVLRAVRAVGARVDCVSAGELEGALAAGFRPEEVTFTADLFDREALAAVVAAGCAVNVGSEDMLEQYAERGPRREVYLRVNPGFGDGHDRRVNTGGPFSKHGIWHANLAAAVARARGLGLRTTGLHVHIGSGGTQDQLERAADAVRGLAPLLFPELVSVSAGGGLPVDYRGDGPPFDLAGYVGTWRAVRDALAEAQGHAVELEVEPGRYLVARPALVLAEVRAVKDVDGLPFVLVDAGFQTLCRPALYGAYHAIGVLGRERDPLRPTMVAGPLCESGDVFTQGRDGRPDPRPLPACRVGDLVCIHDTGAYGASMASRYNSSRLAAEVAVRDGRATLVRPRSRT